MWILFTLFSAIILASKKIQEKRLVGTIGPALGWMFMLISFISIFSIWLIFSRDTIGMFHSVTIMVVFLVMALYPLQIHCYYRAMHVMPISTLGMLAGIVPLTSLILSSIFFRAPISLFGALGIILTVISIAVLSYRKTQDEIHPSALIYAVAAYVLFGIWNIIDKTALSHIAAIPYTMIKQFAGAITLFLYAHYFLGNTHIASAKKHI